MGRYFNDFIPFKSGGRSATKGGREKLEQLLDKIMSKSKWENDNEPYIFEISSIDKDLRTDKVDFGAENIYWHGGKPVKIQTTSHGLDFIAMTACTDWQSNVVFFIYWDGKKYRAYIPIHGNPINTLNKEPFGDDEDEDYEYAKKYGYSYDVMMDDDSKGTDAEDGIYNYEACLEDFQSRVVVDGVKYTPKIKPFDLSKMVPFDEDDEEDFDNYNESNTENDAHKAESKKIDIGFMQTSIFNLFELTKEKLQKYCDAYKTYVELDPFVVDKAYAEHCVNRHKAMFERIKDEEVTIFFWDDYDAKSKIYDALDSNYCHYRMFSDFLVIYNAEDSEVEYAKKAISEVCGFSIISDKKPSATTMYDLKTRLNPMNNCFGPMFM